MVDSQLDNLEIELEVLRQERDDIQFNMIEATGEEYKALERDLSRVEYDIELAEEGIRDYERMQG